MGDNSEKKIREGGEVSSVIAQSRRACVATRDLLKDGLMGYFSLLLTK